MNLSAFANSLPFESEVDREIIARAGLHQFVRDAWEIVEPSVPLIFTWHMDQICAHLEAVSQGECQNLIINIPPGCSKSMLTSVLWPAWDWIAKPSRKWLVGTFDAALAFRDAMACRRLVHSPWYQARWPHVVIGGDPDTQETQSVYNTSAGGRRVSVTVNAGKATGWHADVQLIDDPIKVKDVTGSPEVARAALERAWQWFTQTMSSRRIGLRARVIIMQRVHEADLVGRILESDRDRTWTHLCLPMEYEAERRCSTKWGGDIRLAEGQLLCPERFDQPYLQDLQSIAGGQTPQSYAAQYQQRPAPSTGNIFQRDWFTERWEELPADLYMVQSWDCAFKDAKTSDPVAGHVWGYKAGKFYLVDRIHDRMGLPATAACIKTFWRRWPRAMGKLIEAKANGPAVEQVLRKEVPGLILIEPEGGKLARANAIAPLAKAGNIVLPSPSAILRLNAGKPNQVALTYEWIDKMLEELVTFPESRHDDDVDAMTQAIIFLHDHGAGSYLEAMRRVSRGEINFGN